MKFLKFWALTAPALILFLAVGSMGEANAAATAAEAASVNSFVAPTSAASSPQVYYTDILSGPNSGGENGKGVYLSIFGKNFGSSGLGSTVKVYIDDVEVDNYRYLGASKGRADIQQITVQVGALGNPTPGMALPIKVVVNGMESNTDKTFIVNPGRILFVDNLAGNDSTAVPGDIAKPYRYVQTPALTTGGAWPVVQPGDLIVMRGHGNANPWTDVGFEGYFMRYRNKSGTAPTGVSGTGPIVIMGYPGEDVYIRGTVANGMTGGCISAINGQSFAGMGQWAVVTNLRMDCEGYDGPISQEVFGHNWRVVNNDLAASTARRTGSGTPKMAGITGNGNNSVWYGNHIHEIQGSAQECHGIYIDGDGSYDIAYNHIHDIRDGNGFQVYVNGGNGSDMANNVSLHHNLIHDVSKHGVNIGDGMTNNLKVWNNVVYNTQYAAVRFNTYTLNGAKIYNNTFYNTNLAGSEFYGALTNDWNLPAGSMDVENNIFYVASGTPYNSGSNGVPASAGTFAHNLWFNGSGTPEDIDSAPVMADPQFANIADADFHLKPASPAIAVGSTAVLSLVTDDFDLTQARTAPVDLGALPIAGSTSGLPAVTVAPAIQGTAQVGNQLSVSTGTWTNSPTDYQYQVMRDGADVAGSTSNTYLLTSADSGKTITWRVTARNAQGSTAGYSNTVKVGSTATKYVLSIAVASGSGTLTSAPAGISCGTSCSASFDAGSSVVLTANAAAGYAFSGWGGACSSSLPSCTVKMTAAQNVTASFAPIVINGACGPASGATFSAAPTTNLCLAGTASAVSGAGPWSWTCTGTNGGNTTSCSANRTSTQVPVNTARPMISGTPQPGNILRCSPGTWGNAPTQYAYTWKRGSKAIRGATTNSYTVVSADVGRLLVCSATATNTVGSATAVSAAVMGVAAVAVSSPALVQSKTLSLGSGAATLTLDRAVTAGNWVALGLVSWNNAPHNWTVSDNQGHADSEFGSVADLYVDPFGTMWTFVKANASGIYTLNFNTNHASFGTAYVFEISGADPNSFLDVQGVAVSGRGTTVAGSFAATTRPNDLLLMLTAARSGSATISADASAGWSTVAARSEHGYLMSAVQQRTVTASGSYPFGATLSASVDWRVSAIVVRGRTSP